MYMTHILKHANAILLILRSYSNLFPFLTSAGHTIVIPQSPRVKSIVIKKQWWTFLTLTSCRNADFRVKYIVQYNHKLRYYKLFPRLFWLNRVKVVKTVCTELVASSSWKAPRKRRFHPPSAFPVSHSLCTCSPRTNRNFLAWEQCSRETTFYNSYKDLLIKVNHDQNSKTLI